MSDIRVIERPEWISWDMIHECLWKSHEVNRKQGINMQTMSLQGEELEKRIQKDALAWKTFVALDGDKLVGTGSISIKYKKSWYVNGKVAYLLYGAVLPEYSGHGVYKQLVNCRENEGKRSNCVLIYFDTAEQNKRKITMDLKNGYHLVDFFASAKSHHYSVVLAKWYGNPSYSDLCIKLRYLIKKMMIKILYKPGKKKRFF